MRKLRIYHILAVTLGVLASVLWVYFAIVMENVINTVLSGDFSSFGSVLLFFVIYVLVVRIVDFVSELCKINYVNSSVAKLRSDYIASKHHSDRIKEPSKIISVVSNDINQLKDLYFANSIDLVTQIITFLVSSFLMIQISVIVTLILYALIALLFLLPRVFRNTLEKLQMSVSTSNEKMVSKINDHFLGFDVLRDYNVNDRFLDRELNTVAEVRKKFIKVEALTGLFGEMSHFLVTMIGCVGFLLGSYYVMKGSLNYGEMIAIVQLSNTLVSPISSLMSDYSRFVSGRALLKEIKADIADEDDKANEASDIKLGSAVGEIAFKDVSLKLNDKLILRDIDLKFENGKKYLIIGENGSGKSTLLKLIMRYYCDYQGEIFLGDWNIRSLNVAEIAKHIAYVSQDHYLFSGSIKDNVSLLRGHLDLSDIEEALKMVKLTDLVSSYDAGIEKIIDKNRSDVSGGEKERLCLCRAIVEEKDVYLFDEITSSLDEKTADEIDLVIFGLKGTVIDIEHKVKESKMKRYDRIICLSDGHVTFNGTYDEYILR